MLNKRTWLRPCLGLVVLIGWAQAAAEPINVMFTIDVESRSDGNPERDIWGKIPGENEDHGIAKMMDIFDKHSVKATFFVNVYEAATFGEDVLAEVCRTVNDRGHDLQLHTHPKPMFGVWGMSQADLDTQIKILERGKELIKRWTKSEIVAHRAGLFAADVNTIEACNRTGIPMEFSYNIASSGCELRRTGITNNAPFELKGVQCVPVSSYIQASVGDWRSLRFLDIEASSAQEILKVVADLREHGVRTAVIMLHSFSFSRFGKPNIRVEEVLEDLLEDFTADQQVQTISVRELYELWLVNHDVLFGEDYLPTTGWWLTYCRSWQRLDEGWKNTVVAFIPPIFIVSLTGGALLWWHRHRKTAKSMTSEAT